MAERERDASPPTPECPDESTCAHCGLRVFWNDYGYVHHSGWADCMAVVDGSLVVLPTTARPGVQHGFPESEVDALHSEE